MPALIWPGKHLEGPAPAPLVTDSIIYPRGRGYPEARPESRLILGDNLAVMAALLPAFEGRISVIYADPPFFTNRKYRARIGRGEDSRKPGQWQLVDGYQDAWNDVDSYLDFLYQRLALMHRLLTPAGTLYLHLDWHADAYARLLLDELFGSDHLLNELIWAYHGPSPIRSAFNRKHDTILAYVKGPGYTFNADAVREPYHPSTLATFQSSRKAGFGKIPNLKRGKVPEDWWYFPVVARLHKERTGYPTQKPEALLERIMLASSNPGDFVADFFCGSGTAPVVATRHGRKFVACDETWRAVHTTRRRLTSSESAPFAMERTDKTPPNLRTPTPSFFRLQVTDSTIRLGKYKEVDYWEIDPNWDENMFMSAAQAERPPRTGEIVRQFRIKTGRRICVRLVTLEGEQFQLDV